MTEWNVNTIRDLLIEAGTIALYHYNRPDTEHKHDASLVTAADRAVEKFLISALAPGDDDAVLIGEESADGTTQEEVDRALANGATWVVDPIDGTAPYANRLPTWGISIGLMKNGAFTDGAVFLPRTAEFYITSGADVLHQEVTADPASWTFDDLTPLSTEPHPYVSTGMVSLPHDVVRSGWFSGKNPMQSIGSAVFSIAKLIRGSYIGYVTHLKLWDIGGSAAMLRRMGYHITFADGRELGTTVTDSDWITDASHPGLWKCRGHLFIARTEETLEFLRRHYHPEIVIL